MPPDAKPPRTKLPVGDLQDVVPTVEQPVRVRARSLPADAHIEPHVHPWAQVAYCDRGVIQVHVQGVAGADETPRARSYILPPSRAVYIAPGVQHAVSAIETTTLRAIYIDASVALRDRGISAALRVTPLLKELIVALDQGESLDDRARHGHLRALVLDELRRSPHEPVGLPMPSPGAGDKRLRALCDALLASPADRRPLAAWATRVGASERTLARLFRDELGTSFHRWRRQLAIAHALPLLARGTSVGAVAQACGYRSESAFAAMFRSTMGSSPGRFLL